MPPSYPLDEAGRVVSHAQCQPVGDAAYAQGLAGIYMRSPAPRAALIDLELAWFPANNVSPVQTGAVKGSSFRH